MSEQQENRIPLVFEDERERNVWGRAAEHAASRVLVTIFQAPGVVPTMNREQEAKYARELAVSVGTFAESLADRLVLARRERSVKLLSEAEKAVVKARVDKIMDEQRKRGVR